MYASVTRYSGDHRKDQAIRMGHDELVPQIQKIPGFIAHYAIDLGDGEGMLVAIFEDEAGVDRFNQEAQDWVQKRVIPTLGPPYHQPPVHAGKGKVKAVTHAHPGPQRILDIP